MVRHISRQELQQTLAARTPLTLIEALPEKYFRDGHLPGAINLPHDQVRAQAAQVLPDKNAFIITYCANTPCQNSRIAAETLVTLGYTNVAEYVGGKQDWVEAGFTLEKSSAAQAA